MPLSTPVVVNPEVFLERANKSEQNFRCSLDVASKIDAMSLSIRKSESIGKSISHEEELTMLRETFQSLKRFSGYRSLQFL